MAQPTPYNRVASFATNQALAPTTPLAGSDFDAEYNAIKTTIDQTLASIALIQRDDGQVANKTVGFDQLKDEVSLGFIPPAAWQTATRYTVFSSVFQGASYYRCLVEHTSGTFATDLAAVKWELVANLQSIVNAQLTPIGFQFEFQTAVTDADPGDGKFRLNNATILSATRMYIDTVDIANRDVSGWVDFFDDSVSGSRGVVYVQAIDNSAFAAFSVTGANTIVAGYRKVIITPLVAVGSFTEGKRCSLSFSPAGSPLLSEIVYVKDFGAAWDGVTDDTAAVAAAIAALPAAGGRLRFPSGTGIVSTITINKPGMFEGAGMAGLTASNAATVIKGNAAAGAVISITALNGGVTLKDLGVTSSVASGSRTGPGVQINAGPQVKIQRVYSTGHLCGFLSQSPGVKFEDTHATLNASHGYLLDGSVTAQNEMEFMSAAADSNGGDGVRVNGQSTGIWLYRLLSVSNGGVGFKALKVGAGIVNDVYFTDPEMGSNTGANIDFSTNSGGAYLTIEGGLLEQCTTLVNLGAGFSGVAISNVTMADHGTAILNNAADVVISNNIIANSSVTGINLGATSTGAILIGNKSKAQGATPVLALTINATAGSFVSIGNDWSSATTKVSGTPPAGSIVFGNKGIPNDLVADTIQMGNTAPAGNIVVQVGIASATGRFVSLKNTAGEIQVGVDGAGVSTVLAVTGGFILGTATNVNVDFTVNNTLVPLRLISGANLAATQVYARSTQAGATQATAGLRADGSVVGAKAILSVGATDGIGYGVGAGGSVTQTTNRTTGVTLNKASGRVITDTTSLAAGTTARFTVANSAVALTDTVSLSIQSGSTTDQTDVKVQSVANGSFDLVVANRHGTTAETGAININFNVIKGVTT